jgi:hypothetical protein
MSEADGVGAPLCLQCRCVYGLVCRV